MFLNPWTVSRFWSLWIVQPWTLKGQCLFWSEFLSPWSKCLEIEMLGHIRECSSFLRKQFYYYYIHNVYSIIYEPWNLLQLQIGSLSWSYFLILRTKREVLCLIFLIQKLCILSKVYFVHIFSLRASAVLFPWDYATGHCHCSHSDLTIYDDEKTEGKRSPKPSSLGDNWDHWHNNSKISKIIARYNQFLEKSISLCWWRRDEEGRIHHISMLQKNGGKSVKRAQVSFSLV